MITKLICFKLEIKVFLVSDYSQLTAAGASLVTGAIVPRIAEEETRPKPGNATLPPRNSGEQNARVTLPRPEYATLRSVGV